jgi:hypothetical protein
MTLDVVGAGFGRTGTLSFKLALEQLGFGPCYHMLEVFATPAHVEVWAEALDGTTPDWHALFAAYRSTCDWPACAYWREIKTANPSAKVVLTRRDPNAWYESMCRTIFEVLRRPFTGDDPLAARNMESNRILILERTFGGRPDDRDHTLGVLAAHERDVIASVPAGELLVFDVADGWEPLCAFLGVPVPAEPFPRTNTADDFRTMAGLDEA